MSSRLAEICLLEEFLKKERTGVFCFSRKRPAVLVKTSALHTNYGDNDYNFNVALPKSRAVLVFVK